MPKLPTPYYQDAQLTLYRADALSILPLLSGIDHVISDPPYSANTHKNAKTNKIVYYGTDGGKKLVDFDHWTPEQFIYACKTCIKIARRWIIMTCDHKHAALAFDWPEFIRLGCWAKPGAMPQISADRPGSAHESVLILHNGHAKKRWNCGGKGALWIYPPERSALIPTQKPLNLMLDFVSQFTDPGETVLDFCAGSGTVARACKDLGRRCVAIEGVRAKCDIIVERVSQSTLNLL